jgi:hypothetical protein
MVHQVSPCKGPLGGPPSLQTLDAVEKYDKQMPVGSLHFLFFDGPIFRLTSLGTFQYTSATADISSLMQLTSVCGSPDNLSVEAPGTRLHH